MITITLTGVQETIDELDRRIALRNQNVNRTLEQEGAAMAQEMKDTHTFINRTGWLELSIGHDVTPWLGDRARLDQYALAHYASQVEFGHPGPPPARPYPFFWPVFYAREPGLQAQLDAAVHLAMDEGQAV